MIRLERTRLDSTRLAINTTGCCDGCRHDKGTNMSPWGCPFPPWCEGSGFDEPVELEDLDLPAVIVGAGR